MSYTYLGNFMEKDVILYLIIKPTFYNFLIINVIIKLSNKLDQYKKIIGSKCYADQIDLEAN